MQRIALVLTLAACSGPAKPTPAPPGGTPIDPVGAPGKPSQPGLPNATPDKATIDGELAAKAAGFVDAFSNTEPAFSRDGKQIVFISNRDGLPQLYLASGAIDTPTRILTTKERITGPMFAPGGKDIVFRSDVGADENWSFFRVGLDGKNLVELTPGAKLNRDQPFIPDGKPSTMFFSARAMSQAKSTVYSASATAASEPKAIFSDPKPAFLVDVTANAQTALVQRYPTRSENYVLTVDVASGKSNPLYPAEGKFVSIFDAKFSRDGKRVIVATDGGTEQAVLLSLDAQTGKVLAKHEVKPPTAQINNIVVAKEGGLVAVTLLAGNHSIIRVLDSRSLTVKQEARMPLGAGAAYHFSEDGKRLAVQWSNPNAPPDLFSINPETGSGDTLRIEERPTIKKMPRIQADIVDIPAFDGGKIPTNVYRPVGIGGKRPVIVSYHGGPSGTSVIRWNASTAYFLSLGYAVVEPNVRGSGGFGRAFEEADNGRKRLDAFKDIETSARWVAAQDWADKDRLVVFGGSYGGYTVLIALSRWPDIWKAGVNLFGVVDLKTFMATTSGLIRDIFLLEFGDPDRDAEFLTSISPLTDVGKIVDPTFVYAGANDPRVPRSESDIIVKALRGKRIATEYMVSNDEGHSLARRENQIELYARVAKFLDQHINN